MKTCLDVMDVARIEEAARSRRKETRMLKLECGRCGVSFVMATENLEYVTQVFCPSCRTPVELPPEEDDQDEDDLWREEEDADEDE